MRISDWSSDVCSSDLGSGTASRSPLACALRIRRRVPRALQMSAEYCSRSRLTATILSFSPARSEEHTSELQSLMRISYAVFCLKKTNKNRNNHRAQHTQRHYRDL